MFKKGQRVVKLFFGLGDYKEVSLEKIFRIKNGIVELESGSGVTYNATTGKEIENFFPPMRAEILPIK